MRLKLIDRMLPGEEKVSSFEENCWLAGGFGTAAAVVVLGCTADSPARRSLTPGISTLMPVVGS